MTPRLYITLGRAGDILNVLPLLYLDAQAGQRSALMVGKDYAPILEGCSYVDPVIFDGQPHELERAYAEAVATGREVICCQVNGPPEAVAKLSYGSRSLAHATTESFQKEVWKIAGRLEDWRNQPPLVFDRRNPEREAALCRLLNPKKKVILVSTKGTSSPFPYPDLLLKLLRLEFTKGYQVIDLANFQAERIFDLLAVFEKAHCLVTTDSAPLHLAYACPKLPVVALVNDRPLLWNGACWRPNHIAHVRYRDFPRRAVPLLEAIGDIGGLRGFARLHAPGRKIIHVWSEYEAGDPGRNASALDTWLEASSNTRAWVATPIEVGALGQDSLHSELKDSKRFPYVHDALRLACLRAQDDDLICLTRRDTKFGHDLTARLWQHAPCFAHRRLEAPNTHHPAVDLFCFTKAWWRAHQAEYPPRMVLGLDPYWGRCLLELVKKHGGTELTEAVSRAHPKTFERNGELPKYITHNDGLTAEWLRKHSITAACPPVHQQLPCAPLNRRALHPFGYNPSLIRFGDRLLMAYRWHDEGNASTALAMAELDANFNVISDKPITPLQDRFASHEDPRLFLFAGQLHISYVCSTWPDQPPKAVVKYGRLEERSTWNIVDAVQPEHGKNDGNGLEKNWLFFGHGADLCYFYHSDEAVGPFPRVAGHEPLWWPWGRVRGGTTPLPYQGNLLSFFHSRLDNEPVPNFWRYYLGARIIEAKPPFNTLAVSKSPVLRGSEICELTVTEKSSCHHFKANVCFPAGAIEYDGGFLVSVGINDASCALVKVSESDLKL